MLFSTLKENSVNVNINITSDGAIEIFNKDMFVTIGTIKGEDKVALLFYDKNNNEEDFEIYDFDTCMNEKLSLENLRKMVSVFIEKS